MADILPGTVPVIGNAEEGTGADGKTHFVKMENDGSIIAGVPEEWFITAQATGATATVSKAAGAVGVRHIARTVTVSIAAGATAQTPLTAVVRDGATGVGTIIWQGVLSAPVNTANNKIGRASCRERV